MTRIDSPFRLLSFTFLALLLAVLSGCSRPMGSVTGKVTYQNKPLKGGAVSFISTEGLPSMPGTINEDGTFEIAQISAGTYEVIVDTQSLRPDVGAGGPKGPSSKGIDMKTSGPPPGAQIPEGYTPSSGIDAEAKLKANTKRYVAIPPDYADPKKSGLTHTVVGGAQVYNIDLK